MRMTKWLFPAGAALALALSLPGAGFAQQPGPVFDRPIANVPGKSMVAVEVNYAPGQKSSSHRHEGSAFIMAYVVSGAIRSQVDDQPVRVYRAGETWYENPGAHHVLSENASATEPAKLLAVFVLDSDHGPLTRMDGE